MQWFVILLLLAPDAGWIADRITDTVADHPGPYRLVWNEGQAPQTVEAALLHAGLALTTRFDAARIEVRYVESATGDVDMAIRVMDADGVLIASKRHQRKADLPTWRRLWTKVASPLLVTAATGITVYLLYNVRSR